MSIAFKTQVSSLGRPFQRGIFIYVLWVLQNKIGGFSTLILEFFKYFGSKIEKSWKVWPKLMIFQKFSQNQKILTPPFVFFLKYIYRIYIQSLLPWNHFQSTLIVLVLNKSQFEELLSLSRVFSIFFVKKPSIS